MAVDVTNTKLTARDTELAITVNAATADVADTAEVFTITPDNGNFAIYITEGSGTDGAVAWSIGAGTSEHFGSAAALTGSVAQGTTEVIAIDTAKYMQSGDILITLTPASGKKLLTDHAASMYVVEMPF